MLREAAARDGTVFTPAPPLIAQFRGGRVHKVDGRVEALHQWFVRASDRQSTPWERTPLGCVHVQRLHPPPNLVYRLGGAALSSAQYEWSAMKAVKGGCKVSQVPT